MSWIDEEEIRGRIVAQFNHIRQIKTFLVQTRKNEIVPVRPTIADNKYFKGDQRNKRIVANGWYDHQDKIFRCQKNLVGVSDTHQKTMPLEKPLIYVDYNELSIKGKRKHDVDLIVGTMKNKGWNVEKANLDCGDYVLSDRVWLERKTAEDLRQSIFDGRFFNQLEDLAATSSKPILAVYDDLDDLPHQGSIWGSIGWALISDRCPENLRIFRCKNISELVDCMIRIVLQEQTKKKRYPALKPSWKPLSDEDEKLLMLAAIRKIGRKKATKLLKAKKTVQNVVNASEIDLARVVGESSAKRIKWVSTTQYKKEK